MEKWGTPFDGLRKALRTRKKERTRFAPASPAAVPAPEPVAPHEDDESCLMDAMKDVREIADFRELKAKAPGTAPVTPINPTEGDEALEAELELRKIISKKRDITISDTDEYMEWAAPSLSPQRRKEITRSLHEGVYAISDFIDLHGLTEDEAWEALGAFLLEVRKRKLSCIKIIHGRGLRSPGEPVLKSAVKRWLKGPLSKYVTAFATARACDGGLGATYVLLKR